MNRLLASLGNYLYGVEGDTLYINQFGASDVTVEGITASVETDYPRDGRVTVTATGASVIAIRIPAWCDRYTVDKPYTLKDGYALVENDGTPVNVIFDLSPRRVWADARVLRAAGHAAVMRGPVVYCAESVDNGGYGLYRFAFDIDPDPEMGSSDAFGLPILSVKGWFRPDCEELYVPLSVMWEPSRINLIPYYAFANREECDMAVWLTVK
jgi:DUF1680 family protein